MGHRTFLITLLALAAFGPSAALGDSLPSWATSAKRHVGHKSEDRPRMGTTHRVAPGTTAEPDRPDWALTIPVVIPPSIEPADCTADSWACASAAEKIGSVLVGLVLLVAGGLFIVWIVRETKRTRTAGAM